MVPEYTSTQMATNTMVIGKKTKNKTEKQHSPMPTAMYTSVGGIKARAPRENLQRKQVMNEMANLSESIEIQTLI